MSEIELRNFSYKNENDMNEGSLLHIQKVFLGKIGSLEPKYGANGKLTYRLNDMEAILEKTTNALEDKLIQKIIMYERIAATLRKIDRYKHTT